MLTGIEIKEKFFKFFESKNHKRVRSSPLIPINDPTILFTNAGMNQFKDFFLGNENPEYASAVTCQKVMRAGGKHNDLDNVGKTPRHHTFFEMLGNFSFGDYFKRDAINYAWSFLTVELGLDPSKLAISVHLNDDEAYSIWNEEIGIDENRIARLGEDNFWSMGETGPCGPCTEIHYEVQKSADLSAKESLEQDDGRYLEIWNLVFMEFEKDSNGELNPLPKPCIDTGMGLERITSVLQGVKSNFDTNIFQDLINPISNLASFKYGSSEDGDTALRVIADHLRGLIFLINEGVLPSNEGRGYVLRRLIRRASRFGHHLGLEAGFLSKLANDYTKIIGETYPELFESEDFCQKILGKEEQRFSSTLISGVNFLKNITEGKTGTISGTEIFKLYDTYGFPLDLTEDFLDEKGLEYDKREFTNALEEQRTRARANTGEQSKSLKIDQVYLDLLGEFGKSDFVGYSQLESNTNILAALHKGKRVQSIEKELLLEVILEKSPFYPEGGGQVGDVGEIKNDHFTMVVKDTRYKAPGLIVLDCTVSKIVGDSINLDNSNSTVTAIVNHEVRKATELNHTSTHLLQAALRDMLGEHVKQSGSLVTANKLRFDFTHFEPISFEKIREIETIVNELIQQNEEVVAAEMSFDQAKEKGAIAFFGEKYGDQVRVLKAGSSSIELCGGCHVKRTGDIGLFYITSESSVSSGIRRIEAVTGKTAVRKIQETLSLVNKIGNKFNSNTDKILDQINLLEEKLKSSNQELDLMKSKSSTDLVEELLKSIEKKGEVKFLIKEVHSGESLKELSQKLQKNSGVYLLFQKKSADKISAAVAVSEDKVNQFHAGKLISEISPLFNGKGGGKPSFAQCGGSEIPEIAKLKEAFIKLL